MIVAVVEEDKILEAEEEVDYCRLGKDKLDHLFNPWRDIDPRWQFCACEAIQQKRTCMASKSINHFGSQENIYMHCMVTLECNGGCL